MKRRISMIAILMMAICNMVLAEDKVTISDFKISAGETKEVSITLDNDADYVAFQFDLYLPEGISVESYEANRTRLPETTTLSMSKQTDGCYRFLSAAMQAEPIVGSSGTIITLDVKASEELEHGEKTGYFRNVKLSKQDATGPTYTEMSFPVTIIEPSVVTVTSVTREYGNPNPTFEYTVTGGALEGIPVIACEATPTSPVGTYPIVVSKGSVKNYSVTYVDGTLTINKAPLTIRGGTYSMKQGDALPEFKAEYEGFKNDETEDVLITKPTLSTTATSASAPGEYPVTVSGAEATNYEMTYVAGTLTIIENGIVVDNVSYEETEDGVVVKNGENSSGSVVIPAILEFNGQTYPVTAIGEGAFKGNIAITSVSIDNGITKIGASAFEGCSNLTEIILGSDIASIGEKAFANFSPSTSAPRRADEVGLTVYCYPMIVPETATNAFENTPIDKALLLVFDDVINDYNNAIPWKNFGTIQGFNGGTGINAIWANGGNAKIYTLDGKQLDKPHKGINIVHMSDGTVKKIVVK